MKYKHAFILRRWHPVTGDTDIVEGGNLALMDACAAQYNEDEASKGSEVWYHTESTATPPMGPADDTLTGSVPNAE